MRNSRARVTRSSRIVCGWRVCAIGSARVVARVGLIDRTRYGLFGRKFVPGCAIVRDAYELNVRGVKVAGLGATRGTIGALAIGLAAGALRLVATRGEAFCTVALITCPAAVWMPPKNAAIKQNTENLDFFI